MIRVAKQRDLILLKPSVQKAKRQFPMRTKWMAEYFKKNRTPRFVEPHFACPFLSPHLCKNNMIDFQVCIPASLSLLFISTTVA